ncbi:hypothetical protein SAMN02746041_01026 [Desulfacinum hydrothermale DSM 13146]|uniref:DUF1634 domain-containing protein n=1 Tax=Desulfacinum hydrothermale DSM 13146 TaxID=1121390 RepID=A0A1W1XAC7_9BACT|nr:DUF1634 domain-containing protein [Desulfacinum hydrothermale]SMC20833.1 hypothetical protein SAMN02746041_01026 [Desulfacinum hydrothermale DSM 13146]
MVKAKATRESAQASPEQKRYADLLFYGAWAGIFLMIVTYVIYLTGLLDPHIPLNEIPHLWRLSVGEFLHEANAPHGWGWALLLGKGDYLNFLGIVLLAFMTIVGFLTLIPAYVRKKDWPFVVIVVLEVLVLALAASGILGAGGH